jgi:hypothetical protein
LARKEFSRLLRSDAPDDEANARSSGDDEGQNRRKLSA